MMQTKSGQLDPLFAQHVRTIAAGLEPVAEMVTRLPRGCAWPAENLAGIDELARRTEQLACIAKRLQDAAQSYVSGGDTAEASKDAWRCDPLTVLQAMAAELELLADMAQNAGPGIEWAEWIAGVAKVEANAEIVLRAARRLRARAAGAFGRGAVKRGLIMGIDSSHFREDHRRPRAAHRLWRRRL